MTVDKGVQAEIAFANEPLTCQSVQINRTVN